MDLSETIRWFVSTMILTAPAWIPSGAALYWHRKYRVNGKLLSHAARQILIRYRALPVDSRVGTEGELRQTLAALDAYHGGPNEVWKHFQGNFGKNHRCHGNHGSLSRYDEMIREIENIHTAIANQEKVLRQAGTNHSLESAKQITERLRQERTLIDDTTRELR